MYVYQGMIFNEFFQTTCYRMSIVVCFIYNKKLSVGLNYWAAGTGMETEWERERVSYSPFVMKFTWHFTVEMLLSHLGIAISASRQTDRGSRMEAY